VNSCEASRASANTIEASHNVGKNPGPNREERTIQHHPDKMSAPSNKRWIYLEHPKGMCQGIFNVSLWDQVHPSDDFYLALKKTSFPSPGFAQVLYPEYHTPSSLG